MTPVNPSTILMTMSGPDVLIVGSDWRVRAMLRAQLLEEGWTVIATDAWSDAETRLLAEGLPRVLVAILDDVLCTPAALDRMAARVPVSRTIVLSARTLMAREALERWRFAAILERPFSIGDAANAVRDIACR